MTPPLAPPSEADAALARTARVVVLHAKAAENPYRSVVHAHRNGEMELAQGIAQQFARRCVQTQQLSYLVELRLGNLEGIECLFLGLSGSG
jgi:hypothetical protein